MVPKKDGSLRVVQDFRELNAKSMDDRYSMKDVNECICHNKSVLFRSSTCTVILIRSPLKIHITLSMKYLRRSMRDDIHYITISKTKRVLRHP